MLLTCELLGELELFDLFRFAGGKRLEGVVKSSTIIRRIRWLGLR